MKKLFFIIVICAAKFMYAQGDTTRIKIILVDSLQQYHIGIAKKDSNTIQLAKTTIRPWSQMNILEKSIFLIQGVFISNPVIAWSVTILLGIGLISRGYKLFNR